MRNSTCAFLGVLVLAGGARAAQAQCGDLLVVLDRSGSMVSCKIDGKTKESMAKDAINAVITRNPSLPMGLFVFPDTLGGCAAGGNCTPGKVVVDVAANGSGMVRDFLAGMRQSCGGTPTGESMKNVAAYDAWIPGRTHYALLITDGQPTCQDGFLDLAMTMPCDGGGSTDNECTYPTKVFDAIQLMASRGIHTFVVGFAGAGTGTGCAGGTPFNPETLNKMADLGGEALPGDTRFYLATDAASLEAALYKIGGKISGSTVGGCDMGGGGGLVGGGQGGGSGQAGGSGQGASGGGAGGEAGGPAAAGGEDGGCACRMGAAGGSGGGFAMLACLMVAHAARRSTRRRSGDKVRPS